MGFPKADYFNWDPLTVKEVVQLLTGIQIPWAFAGGYALELFVGKSFRKHGDIDILVHRKDQFAIQAHLSSWELYRAALPGLKFWDTGEFLAGKIQDIWARPDSDSPWKLQIMLFDVDNEEWIFKRDRKIKGPLNQMWHRTKDGIYYLAPEIQLLYKAKFETLDKDQLDFEMTVPLLDNQARLWLKNHLKKRFPYGHSWINSIQDEQRD